MKSLPALGLTLLLLPSLGATTLVTNQAATRVIGQTSLTASESPDPPTAASLAGPEGVAYDAVTGKIYVADSYNFRILRFASAAAAANGASAEAVFGQPNFTTKETSDPAAPTAKDFEYPFTPAVDSAGTLWVADRGNNRVLGFKNAATAGNQPAADIVLGQPDFTSNQPGTSATQMWNPGAVAVGPDNTLWVLDQANSRVLRFGNATQLVTGDKPVGVLGQPDFDSSSVGTTAEQFYNPAGLWADAGGRLWVADSANFRVLRFDNAATAADADGAPADGVLGQPNFTTNTIGVTAAQFGNPAVFGPTSPYNVYVAADGVLWASDPVNNRVLGFRNAATLANGAAASLVLGQPNFTSSAEDTTARTLNIPGHVSAGPNGSFLVTDYGNSRILVFTDAKAPVLTITTRTGTTTKPTAIITGKATGDVSGVTYKVGTKAGKAAGTTNWRFTAKLKPGKNVISVVATGPGGNSASKKITITRK